MERELKTSRLHRFYPIIIESQDSNRPWTSSYSNIFSTFAIVPSRTLPKCNLAHAVVDVQSLSRVQLFATPWTAAFQASLSFTISRSLLKLMSSGSVMPSNHLILCCSLLLLPSFFPESGSLPMSRLFLSGGQSIGASASATENLSKLY